MRVTTLGVVAIAVSVHLGYAVAPLAQEKVEPIRTGSSQEKKVVVVTQTAPRADPTADLAGMRGITDGALAGVLDGLISWDAGFRDAGDAGDPGGPGNYGDTGETGGPGGIDQDTWDQSGLGDELGDFNDYGSDQERQDAVDALAWEQSGAAEATGKSWDDFDNDEERNAALEEQAEEQKKNEEDTSSGEKKDDESTEDGEQEGEQDSDSGADEIVGKQFPITQTGHMQLQSHRPAMDQVSARTQVRRTLAQMLLDKGR
jgi:hypothetical protein